MNPSYIPAYIKPTLFERGGTFVCNFEVREYDVFRQAITEFGDPTLLIIRCGVAKINGEDQFAPLLGKFSLHTLRERHFANAPRMKSFWELISLNRAEVAHP